LNLLVLLHDSAEYIQHSFEGLLHFLELRPPLPPTCAWFQARQEIPWGIERGIGLGRNFLQAVPEFRQRDGKVWLVRETILLGTRFPLCQPLFLCEVDTTSWLRVSTRKYCEVPRT
jgi:hypothetical protein